MTKLKMWTIIKIYRISKSDDIMVNNIYICKLIKVWNYLNIDLTPVSSGGGRLLVQTFVEGKQQYRCAWRPFPIHSLPQIAWSLNIMRMDHTRNECWCVIVGLPGALFKFVFISSNCFMVIRAFSSLFKMICKIVNSTYCLLFLYYCDS